MAPVRLIVKATLWRVEPLVTAKHEHATMVHYLAHILMQSALHIV
jgi:hypothetical protein